MIDLETLNYRNQVILERVKQGEHAKFATFLRDIEKGLRLRLSDEGDTITTKKRLNQLLSDVTVLQRKIYDDYFTMINSDLTDIALQQAEFEAVSYGKVAKDYTPAYPTSKQVITAVTVNPLQVQGYTGNPLLEPFIKDWSDTQIQRTKTVIQQGYYQGQTNAEITRNLRGTKAQKYNDGELAKINRANKTLVRTTVQHSATQARVATQKANGVEEYEFLATLDSKTSKTCQLLDGRIFKVGEGPLPPMHPNCRSTVIAVPPDKFKFLQQGRTRPAVSASGRGTVSSKETYYSWLKKQPVSFQNNAIGKTRSKLLRNGGLSSDEFAKLSLDKNFKPLTLKEMRNIQPSIFESAGL